MKKGFTLIELLAVIVILAIIALIATPVILNIIEDAKESSNERSAELIVNRLQTEIANRNMKEAFNPELCVIRNNKIFCDDEEIDGIIENLNVEAGEIGFENGKVKYYSITLSNKVYSKGTTKPECFISTTPGEINGYNTNDPECGSDIVIPSNMKLPISKITYTYNHQKCQEFASTELGAVFNMDCNEESDGADITEDLSQAINSEYWQIIGLYLFIIDRSYEVVDTKTYKINKIGRYAFYDYDLTSVVIPNTIVDMGEAAFASNNITEVKMPKGVSRIKDSLFTLNPMKKVVIPENIEIIGPSAFGYSQLEELIIKAPKSNLTIERDAYSWASSKVCENAGTVDDTCITWEN